MAGLVTRQTVPAAATAVVRARTTWPDFPTLWPSLLDEVWTCLRAAGITRGCPNVMLYRDEVPNVEVGVLLTRPCVLTGRVVESSLPAGSVATALHRGPNDRLGATHHAVVQWCDAQGCRPAGPRWEIYGPHRDDPELIEVRVAYLLT